MPYNFSGTGSFDNYDLDILDLDAQLLLSNCGGLDSRVNSVNYNRLNDSEWGFYYDDKDDDGLKENHQVDYTSKHLVTVLPAINVSSPLEEDKQETTDSKTEDLIGDVKSYVFSLPMSIPSITVESSDDSKCESVDIPLITVESSDVSKCESVDFSNRDNKENVDNNNNLSYVIKLPPMSTISASVDVENKQENISDVSKCDNIEDESNNSSTKSKENVFVTEQQNEEGKNRNIVYLFTIFYPRLSLQYSAFDIRVDIPHLIFACSKEF